MALPTGRYHLPESLGLLLFGLENTVGTITIALPGAPDQAASGASTEESGFPLMFNDFHANLPIDR